MTLDVRISNHGSIFLFDLLTDAARAWVDANVAGEAMFFGGALAVEHRFAADLASGMAADGLAVA
jgi:hypothetical protein